MDADPVRILMVLGPVDDTPTFAFTPITTRYLARLAMRDFAEGHEWDGRPVIRALIVDVSDGE